LPRNKEQKWVIYKQKIQLFSLDWFYPFSEFLISMTLLLSSEFQSEIFNHLQFSSISQSTVILQSIYSNLNSSSFLTEPSSFYVTAVCPHISQVSAWTPLSLSNLQVLRNFTPEITYLFKCIHINLPNKIFQICFGLWLC
jgi:hypothetical protein